MTPPVIGIVGYHHMVPRPFGLLPVSGAPTAYVDAVRAAGGVPVLLPQDDALALLGIVDGIVLTGGGDLDPRQYAGDPAGAEGVDPVRDAAELSIAREAVLIGLPVLGVCRGLQVLAVGHGGSLRRVAGHVDPEHGHGVRTAPASLVHGLLGDVARTSAVHRWAVADTGPRWRATAWTEDGTVEAVEPTDGAHALGVQWHPELTGAPFHDATGSAIFGWLVSTAMKESHDRPVLAGSR